MWLSQGQFASAAFNGFLTGRVDCLFVRYFGFADFRRIGDDAERGWPWRGLSWTSAWHDRCFEGQRSVPPERWKYSQFLRAVPSRGCIDEANTAFLVVLLLKLVFALGKLKTSDIDRARMQLRVRDGKGAKGRVLPLSERLLKELVNYWRAQRQGKAGHDSPWLFLGKKAGQPMSYIRRTEHLLQRVEKERCALQ